MTPQKKLEKIPLALPNEYKNQIKKLPLALPNKNQFEKLPLTPEAAGSYMANLVPAKASVTSAPVVTEPKVMATENTGGEGGNDSGKIELEYPTYQSYQDYVNGRESSILEAYDAAKKYAEETRTGAHDAAKDNYRVAAREAAGNFRANQPTYGANAEQLLSSGLTGSGYSDYLGGKAYEARANEINAARSQMNYAMMLADQEYNKAIADADINKADAMDKLGEFKFSYSTQLNEAYKAKVDEAVQKIMDGYYDADVAAKILRNYTTDGQLSDDVLAILKSTEDNYWKANNSSMKSAFIDYINSSLAAGIPLTEASMRQWLIDNVKGINEDELAAYMDGYFKDGKLDKNAVAGAVNNKPQTGTTDNDTLLSQLATALNISVDELKNKLGIQTSGGGTGGSGGTGETKTNPYTFEQTIDTFQKFVSDHKAKNAEDYKAKLEELVNDSLVDGSKAWNQEAAEKIRNMASGLVVSSGTFDRNNGFQRSFQEGDNFHVSINGETYRVDSQGYASDEIKNAAKDIADGVVFGYGSELYLKVGYQAVKIGPRPGIGNRDYDKLWRAVYGEQLSNIKAGVNEIKNEGKQTLNAKENTETSKENTEEREPLLYQAYMGVKNALDDADQSIQNGVDKLFFNNSKNEAEDQTTDSGETNATEEKKGLFKNIGDFFRNIRLGSKAFGDKTSLASPTSNIRDAIASVWPKKEDTDAEPKEITRGVAHYERDGMFDRGLVKGDNFTVEVNGKSYKVESGGEVTDQNVIDAANASGIYNGEVFMYGDDLYIKRNNTIYSVEQRFFAPKQDDKLKEAISENAGAVPGEGTEAVSEDSFVLGNLDKMKTGKKIEVEDGEGNIYKVQIRSVLGSDSAAYKSASSIEDGEAFIYGNDVYIKYGGKAYKISATGARAAEDYDNLIKSITNDNSNYGIKADSGIVVPDKVDVGKIKKHSNEYVVGNAILIPIGQQTYGAVVERLTKGGAYQRARNLSLSEGEVFLWNDTVCVYLGDEVAVLGAGTGEEGQDNYKAIVDAIEKGPQEDLTSYSRYLKETT